jgi:TolB-like protein/DNA-binding winged helix-turn-helix (wHTH) protein/Flp pilus assembly protein TadD
MPDAKQAPALRRFGVFEINLQSGELRKNGIRLRLSGQPFQVLSVLIERPGEVVTREELHSRLWPADTFVDFDHGLNNAVARIREVLDDSSETPRYVETLPRRGYRFIAPVADLRPATELPSAAHVSPAREVTQPAPPESAVLLTKRSSARLWVLLGAAAVLVLFAVTFVLSRGSGPKATMQPAIKSLAVLPLKNLSGDPTQEYLADGMTEELIGRLAAIHNLRVVSRTSAMHFKDTKLPVPEIARALQVDALVEGSVIREGNRIRVHAQLIRGATDEHFWSESYDRELGDVLALENEVAQSIARKVEVTVTGQEHTRLVAARHITPEVYESYLKGQFALRKSNDRSELEESVGYFDEAIKKDPTFALAYVGLAEAYNKLGMVFIGANPAETRPKVISAARKALELDPALAEAHVQLADGYQREWRWSDAEAEYKWALQLRPNDAAAHLGLARWLLAEGRSEEAMEWSKRARELDPLAVTGTDLAWILFLARRYDEAIRELHARLAVKPDDALALWYLGFSLVGEGKAQDAIPPLQRAVSITHGSPGAIGVLARAYGHAGRRAEALRLINELQQRRRKGYVPTAPFIQAYIGLGDYNQAFAWFERGYQERSNLLMWIKVEPFPEALRNDPRFIALVHRVGLD